MTIAKGTRSLDCKIDHSYGIKNFILVGDRESLFEVGPPERVNGGSRDVITQLSSGRSTFGVSRDHR